MYAIIFIIRGQLTNVEFHNFPSWPKVFLLLLFADLTRQAPEKETMGHIWRTPSTKTCKNTSYLLVCFLLLFLFKETTVMRVKIRPDKSIRWNLMNIWMLKMTKLFLVLVSVPSFLGSCLCTSCEDHWCTWVSFSTMCFIFMEL